MIIRSQFLCVIADEDCPHQLSRDRNREMYIFFVRVITRYSILCSLRPSLPSAVAQLSQASNSIEPCITATLLSGLESLCRCWVIVSVVCSVVRSCDIEPLVEDLMRGTTCSLPFLHKDSPSYLNFLPFILQEVFLEVKQILWIIPSSVVSPKVW